jgi:hypothetical protein
MSCELRLSCLRQTRRGEPAGKQGFTQRKTEVKGEKI